MEKSSKNLYGNVPDTSPVVLLLIDVINDLEFPEGPSLLRHALPMARRLARLKQHAKKRGAAVIYVNDNFGRWRSDFKSQVDHCLKDGVAGRKIVELLRPDEDDYFVLKPAHSGFFSTTLDLLLRHL
jgi:nicotinamidase-related amidase